MPEEVKRLIQEYQEGRHREALITILERVILDHEIQQDGRLRNHIGIERLTAELLKRHFETTF